MIKYNFYLMGGLRTMVSTKCKDHFYGRKLDDAEVKNGINHALDNLRYILPNSFQVNVVRKDCETIIKVI